jgi:hypothetical protein
MTEFEPSPEGEPRAAGAAAPTPSETSPHRRQLVDEALTKAHNQALRKGRRFTLISRLGDTALFETTTPGWVKRVYRVRLTRTDKVIIERVR